MSIFVTSCLIASGLNWGVMAATGEFLPSVWYLVIFGSIQVGFIGAATDLKLASYADQRIAEANQKDSSNFAWVPYILLMALMIACLFLGLYPYIKDL